MSTVLIAAFNDYEAAARVRVTLVADGFPTDRVELTASCEVGRAQLAPADSLHGKCVQYFRTLLGRPEERDFPERLAGCVDNGGAIVTVLPRGAIETARAAEILDQGHPDDVVGHDLTNHGWEHAAARHGGYWVQHLWLEHSADSDCLYCRLFPSKAHTHSH
jgi:hypothetical protein